MKEEQEGQHNEQILLKFIEPFSERMNMMKELVENPHEFQPKELFDKWTKIALLVLNQYYDPDYTTFGDLPAVVDDMKNARQLVKMMGILEENTFVLVDATHQQIEEINKIIGNRIAVLSSPLKDFTGVQGPGILIGGIPWEILRPNAMKLELPFDSITIDLNSEDQIKLENLVKL